MGGIVRIAWVGALALPVAPPVRRSYTKVRCEPAKRNGDRPFLADLSLLRTSWESTFGPTTAFEKPHGRHPTQRRRSALWKADL